MSPAQSPTPANVPDRAHRSPGAAWLSRAVAPVIAVIAILASLLGVAPHAQAADSFVYWGYWQQTNGSWVYSQVGAATANPADGTVEGWRWMIDEGGAKPRPPRLTATFAQLCGSTPAEAGKKRVGLVVDQIIGNAQTVIKQLSKLHAGVKAFSGATILGDGTVALILDTAHLVSFGQSYIDRARNPLGRAA